MAHQDKIRLAERLRKSEAIRADELDDVAAGKYAGSNFVPSKVALAKLFGVDRATIMQWSKLDGAPIPAAGNRHNVSEWASFIREQNLSPESTGGTADEETLNARKLRLQCEKIQLDIDIASGRRVDADAVKKQSEAVIAAIVQTIEQMPMPDGFHKVERSTRDALRQTLFDGISKQSLFRDLAKSD